MENGTFIDVYGNVCVFARMHSNGKHVGDNFIPICSL